MNEAPSDPIFAELRPRLVRLAYRMLGSVTDAEDIVQDSWLRWLATDRASVREPAAFLRTVVTRLCLNELKSARRRRESYVGSWLPEPIFDPEDGDAADDITMPLMLALERLSPLERAAFLLHDVFGMSFDEISSAIGREAAACRKLASRARAHVTEARPRFAVGKEEGLACRRLLHGVENGRYGLPSGSAFRGCRCLCRRRRQGDDIAATTHRAFCHHAAS